MIFLYEFHKNGLLAKGMNYTFIGLIPKVNNPQGLGEFRPISVVGCLYKVLANVFVNRLWKVIGSIVSELWLTFVKGRQIMNEILIANEINDKARRSKKELRIFKVDSKKTYDLVDEIIWKWWWEKWICWICGENGLWNVWLWQHHWYRWISLK